MKKLLTSLIILIFALNTSAQKQLKGTLYNVKTNKQIALELKNDQPSVSIMSYKRMTFYKVDKEGYFYIPLTDFLSFSNSIDLSIRMFYSDIFNFADYELKNIPKDSLGALIQRIYIAPAYWKASCGTDCFTINNRKTFYKREIIVSSDFYEYKIRRIPKRIKQSMLAVYYETDFNKDLIK